MHAPVCLDLGEWFCLRLEPGRESIASLQLMARNIRCYLPAMIYQRHRRNRLVEGDYDWADAHLDRDGAFFANFTDSFSVKSLSSLTGRFGYAWGRFLPYVKGGAAWERDEFTFNFFPSGAIATVSTTRSGWTLGIGGEYAFTNWITGFVEYDHYNFARDSDNFVCGPFACFGRTFGFPVDVKETADVFKVGLNLLWSPGPGAFGLGY